MPEYRRSTTVQASPDELFDFLSRVENLPRYMTRMTSARPVTGDEVEVTARLDDVPQAPDGETVGHAQFSVDADQRAIRWAAGKESTQDASDYHGELQVTPTGDGATVEVTLHTRHDDEPGITEGMDQTLAKIREAVEERPSLQE